MLELVTSVIPPGGLCIAAAMVAKYSDGSAALCVFFFAGLARRHFVFCARGLPLMRIFKKGIEFSWRSGRIKLDMVVSILL